MKAAILLCVTSFTAALEAGSSLAEPAFQPSQTAAELTLAQILKLDGDKPDQVDLHRRQAWALPSHYRPCRAHLT